MSIFHHHPTDFSLARYAAGTLERGPALVIAAHLEACGACRERVSDFEMIGGAFLEDLPPVAMEPHALSRAFARIEMPAGVATAAIRRPVRALEPIEGLSLPRALRQCDIGRWRWGGPGVRWSRVGLPGDERADVKLLRIGAGRKMPHHGHTGTEFTLVLKGSFSDETGHYRPGDLVEADAETEHQPVVDADGECICLAAVEGRLRLGGFLGRLLQPLTGA